MFAGVYILMLLNIMIGISKKYARTNIIISHDYIGLVMEASRL
jgi:hypothetical protein